MQCFQTRNIFRGDCYLVQSREPLMPLLPMGPPIESWHGVQRQIVRFCVVNLRNSGQASRAIYALRILFHHNLFAPDSIRGFLDSPSPNTGFDGKSASFFDSTNRTGFSCSLLISHLPLTHWLMFTGSDRKSHRHRNHQEDNLSPGVVWGEAGFASDYNQEPRLFLHIFLDVAIC